MTIEALYRASVAFLASRGLPTPEADARALIGRRMITGGTDLFLHRRRNAGWFQKFLINRDVRRRGRFVPVAYILGYKDFFQDRFRVSRRCLIPRADTEHLLYAVQDSGKDFRNILDIGTGSGALAVSLSRLYPDAAIDALDIHTADAKHNIRVLKTRNVRLIRADFMKIRSAARVYDLVISNPPYLGDNDLKLMGNDARLYEPGRAFYGGKDGLDFYRKTAYFCKTGLSGNGLLVLETDHKWESVVRLLKENGFKTIDVIKDYNGLERVITALR